MQALLNAISQSSWFIKGLVLLTLWPILFGLSDWLLLRDKMNHYLMLKKQRVDLNYELEGQNNLASQLAGYQQQLVTLQKQFKPWVQKDNAGLLDELSVFEKKLGFKISSFVPQPLIKLLLHGTYHQLALLIDAMATMKHRVRLLEMNIEPAPSSNDYSQKTLVMTLTLKRYQYQEENKQTILAKSITPLPKITTVPAFHYPSQERPSPFEWKNKTKHLNNKAVLTAYPLNTLSFVGTITTNKIKWALIQSPQHQIIKIGIGQRLGENEERILYISDEEIQLEDTHQPIHHKRVLKLNGKG